MARWREVVKGLPPPFEAVHLDERSPEVEEASDGRNPCVLAAHADGSVDLLLGPEELEVMGGEPSRLAAALSAAWGPGLLPISRRRCSVGRALHS